MQSTPTPHTVLIAVACRATGADLDTILTTIERQPGVSRAFDLATFNHGPISRLESVAAWIDAAGIDPNDTDDTRTRKVADALADRGFTAEYQHTGGGIWNVQITHLDRFYVAHMLDSFWSGCGFRSRAAYEAGEENLPALDFTTTVPSDSHDLAAIVAALALVVQPRPVLAGPGVHVATMDRVLAALTARGWLVTLEYPGALYIRYRGGLYIAGTVNDHWMADFYRSALDTRVPDDCIVTTVPSSSDDVNAIVTALETGLFNFGARQRQA